MAISLTMPLVATESRTSSPVRIPSGALNIPDQESLSCGEGAGYAGIVSAAMDGERVPGKLQLY